MAGPDSSCASWERPGSRRSRARPPRRRRRSWCRSAAPSAPATASPPASCPRSSTAGRSRTACATATRPTRSWSAASAARTPCPIRTKWRPCLPAAEPRLHLPAGSVAHGADPVHVTPAVAGWTFSGLRVLRLAAGASRAIDTGANEMVVLPLSGSFSVRAEGHRFRLEGRASVFDRVTDFAYLPRDTRFEIESDGGGEFALPMAQARRRLEPAYGPAERVPVEIRGAGDATRQVTNFCTPGTFAPDPPSA